MAKIQCNVISYVLKRTVDITVVIPTPTFGECMKPEVSHTPKAPYPVLYLLHGMGNNHATWTGYTNVELYAEEHQIAIVCMSGENGGYITKEGGDDYFRFISEELPDFVTGIFPVSKRPEDTYIAGLSMGGGGTLVHGLSFPERFCAMGVLSIGGRRVDDKAGSVTGVKLPPVAEKYVPETLADNIVAAGKKFPKIYYACGTKDFLYPAFLKMSQYLKDCGADVTTDSIEGYGHEWRFWDIEIEKFLKWLPRTDAYAAEGPRKA